MANEPKIGDFLGHYRLVELLAVGGMGMVFRAHEESLNRYVAVKVLAPDLAADREFVQRFLQEARAVANLNHPNTLQIHYIGQQQGVLFFAMEFVDGPNLEKLTREKGMLSSREAITLIRQAAIGLRHALKQGIIHRDIKPTNVMINSEGVVKLTDFGLARNIKTDGSHMTTSEGFLGTPDYVSPEEARGVPVDHRSDIYSLGATLFHLLTGRPPFVGDNPLAILKQHIESPPPPVRRLNPQVPAAVVTILDKCLAKQPDGRYQTYDALIRDLDGFLAAPAARPAPEAIRPPGPRRTVDRPASPILSPSPASPESVAPPSPPPKTESPVASIVFTIVLIIGTLALMYWWPNKSEPDKPASSGGTGPGQPAQAEPRTASERESLAKRSFAQFKLSADEKLKAGNFAGALGIYQQWPAEKYAQTQGARDVDSERERITVLAGDAWRKLDQQARDLRQRNEFDGALKAYTQAATTFAGIRELETDIRERRQETERLRDDWQRKQAAALLAAAREQELKFQQLAGPVNALMITLQFEKAVQELRRLSTDDPVIKRRLAQLQSEVDRLVALKQIVNTRVAAKPGAAWTLATRTGQRAGQLVQADADGLVLRQPLGAGGTADITVTWAELQPVSALKVFAAFVDPKNADELLAYAVLQVHYAGAGLERIEDARLALQAVAQLDATRAAAIEPFLARLRDAERAGRDREAAALWERIQQSAARQQWDAVQRELGLMTDLYGDTDFVKEDKRAEMQQFAKTLAATLAQQFGYTMLDLGAAYNGDVISTPNHAAAEMFDAVRQAGWETTARLRQLGLPDEGLPDDGRVPIPGTVPKAFFQMRPPPAKTAIVVSDTAGKFSGEVRAELPVYQHRRYSQLAFLHASTWGDGEVRVTVQYETGAAEVFTLQVHDCMNSDAAGDNTAAALTAHVSRLPLAVTLQAQVITIDARRLVKGLSFAFESRAAPKGMTLAEAADKFFAAIFAVAGLPAGGATVTLPSLTLGSAVTQTGKPPAVLTGKPDAAVNDPARWKRAINLLPLIDRKLDTVSGQWKRKLDVLQSDDASPAKIEIPFQPPEEYDFRIRFTPQNAGDTSVNQLLAKAGRAFMWCLGAERNTLLAFESIARSETRDQLASLKRKNCLEAGRPYTSLVQVRNDGLRAFFDGVLVVQHKTDYKDLGTHEDWHLRNAALLGLGTWNTITVFDSVEVLEITGHGTFTRPSDPAAREAIKQQTLAVSSVEAK